MSLLLDALKKAAEQKARQAKAGSEGAAADQDATEFSDLDETQARDDTVATEDRTIGFDAQTEVSNEYTEERTRDQTVRINTTDDETDYNESGSDTTILAGDDTLTHTQGFEFNEDDTYILDEEATITEAEASEAESQFDDETEHTVVGEIDGETEYDLTENTVLDDTVISQEDRTEFTQPVTENISSGGGDGDTIRSNIDSDATEPALTSRDISNFIDGSGDDTEINEDDSISDMSLMLVDEHDDTTQYAENDTLTSQTHSNGFLESPDTENLRIVEDDYESATKTSTITADQNETVTTGIELESLRHEHTIIRPEVTSTHTYAPDNYDRTLIRPPSDDASKIFAGMKAEEDVLMTPDYAKRVFLSKSSANRLQHYKIYLGIAVSVLLATGIYSMFEVMDEYNRIDTAMLPLKRDPLPGIIQQNQKSPGDVVEQPEIDMQTLKLVENARSAGETEDTQAENETSAEAMAVTGESPENEPGSESRIENSIPEDSDAGQTVVGIETQPEQRSKISTATPVTNEDTPSSGSLQISSSSRLSQVDQWLIDAYAAYQRGDDATALQNYNQVLKEDPLNRNALLARAAIKVQNGDMVDAIMDYQMILHANPKDSLAMSSLISIARAAPEESETQLKLMLRDEPDSPHLNFALANVFGSQNRWQEAQSLYFKALQHKPEDPNYAYNLAVSLEHISQPKAAIAYYEKAVANINNGLATFNKALVDSRIAMLKQL